MKLNTTLGTPLEILPKRARAAYVISRRAKPLSRRRVLRRCVLCMITVSFFDGLQDCDSFFSLNNEQSSSDSGSEDWRWDSSTISDSVPSELSDREIPEGYLQQEIKTSCRIQSCKSTPQPLTGLGAHGPGPAGAGRGAARIVLSLKL